MRVQLIKTTGEEPAMLWKEIEQILRAVEQDFPNLQLNFFLLCPQCIIDGCVGSAQFTSLPVEVLEDCFPIHEERKHYICKRGHSTPAHLVKGDSKKISIEEGIGLRLT